MISNDLHSALITKAYREGYPIAVIRGEQIVWADAAPDDATVDQWLDALPMGAATADAIAAIGSLATRMREQLSGASDPYKAAIYNQRAEYGRQILAGNGTPVMLEVATSECLRLGSIDLDRARAQGLLTGDDDTPDPAAIAVVWRDLDERLARLAAEIDRREADAVAAVRRRRTVDGVAEALAEAQASAEAWIANVQAAAVVV